MSAPQETGEPAGPFDALVAQLQQLRVEAGLPSYGEIAQRVSRVREAHGASPSQARVGRTTVYDAFRLGRRRMDTDLLIDIVRALGVADVDQWADQARQAQLVAQGATPPGARSAPAQPDTAPQPDPPAVQSEPLAADSEQLSVAPERRWSVLALFAGLCLLGNMCGRAIVDTLQLPIFLDMWATALASIVLGPWWGAGVGVATNLVGSVTA